MAPVTKVGLFFGACVTLSSARDLARGGQAGRAGAAAQLLFGLALTGLNGH